MNTITRLLLATVFISFAHASFAQQANNQSSVPTRTCGSGIPGEEFEEWLQPLLRANAASATQRGASTVYTIPVVFHVIHTGTNPGISYNISDAQILSQLDVLNADFRKLNADTATIPSVFSPLAADCEVNFCLAQRDTAGNATTGINRININTITSTPPSLPYDKTFIDGTIKPATIWNVLNYLNIWVVPNMASGATQLLGYATFPAGSGLSGLSAPYGNGLTDGVVLWYRCTGKVGNLDPSYNKGRTATHEIGHWLGLRHIWGDNNCGNDYCSDTPTQQTANFGNPVFPSTSNCLNNAPNGDMFMNYMDYCNDVSLKMFSYQQRVRVQTVLQNAPIRVSQRNSNACTPPVAGIDNADPSLRITVFPNPAQSVVSVQWSALSQLEIDRVVVRNMLGGEVAGGSVNGTAAAGQIDFNTEKLPAGVYFIELAGPRAYRSARFQVIH